MGSARNRKRGLTMQDQTVQTPRQSLHSAHARKLSLMAYSKRSSEKPRNERERAARVLNKLRRLTNPRNVTSMARFGIKGSNVLAMEKATNVSPKWLQQLSQRWPRILAKSRCV